MTGRAEDDELEPFAWMGFEGRRHPDFPESALIEVLERVRTHPFGDDEFTLKRRRYQEIGKVHTEAGGVLAVKRWRRAGGLPRFRCPARRAAESGRRLLAAGVPTPLTLAWVSDRRPARRQADAVVVTRWMEDHRPITLLLAGNRPYERRLRGLLPGIARLVAHLHDRRIGHHDLRLENLLAVDAPVDDLLVVDLDEVTARRGWRALGEARDLANMVFHMRRLDIPDHTSRRLLLLYARERGLDRSSRSRLARRVFAMADLRGAFRSSKRLTAWLPRLRARRSDARSGPRQQRLYGVEPPRSEQVQR